MNDSVVQAVEMFADRTAAMCVSGEWDNAEIKLRMSRFPKEYEAHVVKAVEQRLVEMRDNDE